MNLLFKILFFIIIALPLTSEFASASTSTVPTQYNTGTSVENINNSNVIKKIPNKQKKEYKNSIENIINERQNETIAEIDNIYKKAYSIYNNFLNNKNSIKKNSEYIEELEELERESDEPEFHLYLSLIDETDKYVKIKDSIPPTDFSGTLYEFILPYLKKYKISNIEKLTEISQYAGDKSKKIEEYNQEITKYSKEYETKKIDNFYKKNIEPRINANIPPIEYLSVTMMTNNYNLRQDVFYICQPSVFQILDTGFLAVFNNHYKNVIIYIQSPYSWKLLSGDVFNPFLPLKFTGKYYTYKTIVGETHSVPIFKVSQPNVQKINIPKIEEEFYFVSKPDWSNLTKPSYQKLDTIKVCNERRVQPPHQYDLCSTWCRL